MAVIAGGKVITDTAAVTISPAKARVYHADGIPTDTNIGYDGTPPNGTLADNTNTKFVYERQAGVWVRIDTL
jgi:hypothetical protein